MIRKARMDSWQQRFYISSCLLFLYPDNLCPSLLIPAFSFRVRFIESLLGCCVVGFEAEDFAPGAKVFIFTGII